MDVRWTNTGSIGSYVIIQLYNDTLPVTTLTSATSNAGQYSAYVPTLYGGYGSKFRVKVSSYYDPGIFAFSGYFTISSAYSGTLTITSPAKGATWSAGSYYNVTWTTTGSRGPTCRSRSTVIQPRFHT